MTKDQGIELLERARKLAGNRKLDQTRAEIPDSTAQALAQMIAEAQERVETALHACECGMNDPSGGQFQRAGDLTVENAKLTLLLAARR